MKTLKFYNDLVPLVLSGKKTSTWRFLDDKDLKDGDELILVNKSTMEEFAKALIVLMKEKKFKDIDESDFDDGHEKFSSREEMYELFKKFYGEQFTPESVLKLIKFKIIN